MNFEFMKSSSVSGGHYPDNSTVYGNICVTEYSSLLWLQLVFRISIGIKHFL